MECILHDINQLSMHQIYYFFYSGNETFIYLFIYINIIFLFMEKKNIFDMIFEILPPNKLQSG